jgi:hypothetical protein
MRNLIKQSREKISNHFLEFYNTLPDYSSIKRIKPLFLKMTLVLFLFFSSASATDPVVNNIPSREKTMAEEIIDPKEIYAKQVKDRIYASLFSEVDAYIKRTAPGSKLDPDFLTKKCIEYDMDIIFVLAQGVLESHLGTKGKAASTNSVWNVGTYDNGKVLYTYPDANSSVDPYLTLLKNKYLINVTAKGDTIYKDLHHLIQDNGYINYNGSRFATAKNYENSMRKFIIKIDMETSIGFYQDLYRMKTDDMIAYFVPSQNLDINYSILQGMR